ncbi:glycosyl transferase [Cylindrospermum stagnale PCC 7417]|uniref:Glycosyl transferase n=1 Tax=Cylindrospermum stagnale PCC 7417 TaxID=56107 RepID=K9X4Y9_9NOST|nr:glycosyltransferase family 2 protein [Cylindrospermum stagnale]AFZ26722.1 glycosyl transferase [Cylindrospermum stagnale PCC 7417]
MMAKSNMLVEPTAKTFPSVTVAIPTYNEVHYIENLVLGFLRTSYPNLIEIFVADGGSNDGTQEIVKNLSDKDSRVKLIHNPDKIQSAGLNLIISESIGDVFIRIDAHSDYAPDYIERCVEALLESKASNVGGAQRFVAKTSFQAGVALASKSFLGNGGAKYRNPNYTGYAETVYLGCFWKKSLLETQGYDVEASSNEDAKLNLRFKKVFDTTQITNQDAELNQRLIAQNQQAIYIDSKIRAWYYPRKTWKSLFIQYLKYGRGRYLTSTKHKIKSQLRGLLPFVFISTVILLLIVDLLFPKLGLPIEILIVIGLFLPFLESLRVTLAWSKSFNSEIWRGREDKIPSFFSRWLFCGITLLSMPIAHFSGYAYQLFRQKIMRVRNW